MKKLLSIILTIAILASVIIAVPTVNGASVEKGFSYVKLSDGTAMITGYKGNATNLNVPSKIGGMKVTAIGKMAFRANRKIMSATLPNSVKTLGQSVFANCSKLNKISLGKGITKIPAWTFQYCHSLKTFTTPPQVTFLNMYAFTDSGLETLIIGAGLNRITMGYNVEKLKEFKVSRNNKYFKSAHGVLYDKKATRLRLYPMAKKDKKFTIPKSVSKISAYSFNYPKYLEDVKFTSNVTHIYQYAFADCEKLTKIDIPKNVTYIGECAFVGCKKVKKINIDANKKLKIMTNAFSYCKSLTSVSVPKVSGEKIFSYCSSLKKITIPSNVKTLTDYEFYECPKLKTVTVPKTVTKIGKYALGYVEDDFDGAHSEKIKGFTIKGVKGSAAYKYAKKNGFKFVAI